MNEPADELRAAAATLRTLAGKATHGICPDWTYNAVRHIARNCQVDCTHDHHQGWDQPEWDRYDDAPYIAVMHPGVGAALADWLASEADHGKDLDPAALTVARRINNVPTA